MKLEIPAPVRQTSLALAYAGGSLIFLTQSSATEKNYAMRDKMGTILGEYSGGINFGHICAIGGLAVYGTARVAGLGKELSTSLGISAGLCAFGLLVLNETTGFGGGSPHLEDLILPAIFALNLAFLLSQYFRETLFLKVRQNLLDLKNNLFQNRARSFPEALQAGSGD